MPIEIEPQRDVSVGGTRLVAIDFTDDLDGSVTLTGTPTITEIGTSDLTLTNKAVSTGVLTINDRQVAAGKAVQFLATGFEDQTTYTIRVSCDTNGTPAETIPYDIKLRAT